MSDAHTHTVKDGESVESIAANSGLPLDKIWSLSENEKLRNKRKDPHILNPGDKLAVPATKPLTFDRATGQTHEFSVQVPKSKLKLQLKKHGEPRANQPCELVVDGFKMPPLTTDGSGNLEAEIPAKAHAATLTVGTGKEQVLYKLQLRGIHPIAEPTGWQARLHNLGYPVDVDGDGVGNMSYAALCLFQESKDPKKLPPTGKLDDDTKNKLEQRYGC
jgi:LysM repeat protein